jgi:hypothetical protein
MSKIDVIQHLLDNLKRYYKEKLTFFVYEILEDRASLLTTHNSMQEAENSFTKTYVIISMQHGKGVSLETTLKGK